MTLYALVVPSTMDIDNIMALWNDDSKVDRTDIAAAACDISALHSRYYNIYIREKIYLRKLEGDAKQLKLAKYEFYTQGHDETTREKNWKLPARGMVLKSEAQTYVDADQDVIDLNLKIGLQCEKVDFIESILKVVMNRGYALKTMLDFIRFQSGG